MRGVYDIRVENARVQFKFRLVRNLTVIRGPSATGKTTLVEMIADYEASGPESGITLSSPKRCCVLAGKEWERDVLSMKDCFVFIDESSAFLRSEAFARAIRHTDNYYVIVSRESLPMLPYSVEEVYELKNTTSRYPGIRKFYSHARRMYDPLPRIERPDTVIVEDSNAGYEFFRALCRKSGIECISAGGKGNVLRELQRCQSEKILVIADGAAFGPHMEMVSAWAKRKGAGLFLPESFEHLVLESGIVRSADIPAILENPSEFIDSRDHFSWESFFSSLLASETRGTYLQYSKSRLNPAYLQQRERLAISRQLEATGLTRANA